MTTFNNNFTPRPRYHNPSGFTLVEIILVIAIVGILGAVAAPNLGSFFSSTTIDTAARSIQTDLRYAQMLAQTTSEAYGFRAISATRYEIYEVSTGNVINSPYDQQPLVVDLNDIHSGVRFTATTFPAYVVEFNALGTPSDAVTIGIVEVSSALTQTIDLTVSSGLIMRNNPT